MLLRCTPDAHFELMHQHAARRSCVELADMTTKYNALGDDYQERDQKVSDLIQAQTIAFDKYVESNNDLESRINLAELALREKEYLMSMSCSV